MFCRLRCPVASDARQADSPGPTGVTESVISIHKFPIAALLMAVFLSPLLLNLPLVKFCI